MSHRVAGVDGGGSRTRGAVFDAGLARLGGAEGPASAVDPADPEASAETVGDVVRAAARDAGVPLPLAALHVGLAGAGRAGPRERVLAALRSQGLARRVSLGTDAEIAFHDVFARGPGVLLLAGTGSMVLGRGPGGAFRRVGGWGPLLGDEGSGYAIGRSALRAVARAEDGLDPPTALRAAVLSAADRDDPAGLILWAATADRTRVAALTAAVAAADAAGDAAAAGILDRAASELARRVEWLAHRLGPWTRPAAVALVGGLVEPGGPLRARIEQALPRWAPGFRDQVVDPVRGAGALALDSALQG